MRKTDQMVYSFARNPLEEVRASVTVFKGKEYVDLRIYFKGDDGEYRPSKKGLALPLEILPELEEAVRRLRQAVDEGA